MTGSVDAARADDVQPIREHLDLGSAPMGAEVPVRDGRVDRQLVVLISDEQGVGSAQTVQTHRVVVCGSEESALRYARWWTGGDMAKSVSAMYWPRYFDELEHISDSVIDWLQDEYTPPTRQESAYFDSSGSRISTPGFQIQLFYIVPALAW